MRDLFKHPAWRAAVPYLLAATALLLAIAGMGHELSRHLHAIEAWLDNLGPLGIMAYVGIFAIATSLLVPESLFCIVAGALFGLGWGIAATMLANLLAGSLQFAIAHCFLRARIDRFCAARPPLASIQRAVHHDELRLQLLLRLTPLSPALMSYLLGSAGVRYASFLLASLARTPSLVTEVYFGYAGKHVAQMAGRHSGSVYLHDFALVLGLVACLAALALISREARKAVLRAMEDSETSNPDVALRP